jgi:uncharacterized protein (TIGR04551 family)
MFATEVPPGSGLRLIGIFDWAATGPTSNNLSIGLNQFQGEPFDLTNRDDVSQYGLVVGKINTPEEWLQETEHSDNVWNLGAYIIYRNQDLDQTFNQPIPLGGTPQQVGAGLVKRDASASVFDVWGRWKYHNFLFEGEGALIVGSINGVKDFPTNNVSALDILEGGALGRVTWNALHGQIKLRFEAGYASGDQAESLTPGATNYMQTPIVQPPNDTRITNFHFDPDYHVDLILFRRILGTVTNAYYAKPTFIWDPTERFGFKLDIIQSFAAVPVSTPGNGIPYGLEFDTQLAYRREEEGFYAGFEYGVLFPMSALDQPITGSPAALFPISNGSEAAAQTIRMFLAIKY